MTIIGHCRLCEKYGSLSEEHTPPRKAFNDSTVFLRRASGKNGNLSFSRREPQHGGWTQPTLCETCNNYGGRKFAEAYVKLAKRVATQLEFVPYGQHLNIMAVEKPAQVVKQILMQFVSLTTEGFVNANPWIRASIFERQPTIPSNVRLYLFATHAQTMRSTGLLARYKAASRSHSIFAEFVFWPIGSVLSFGELEEPFARFLSPISHWAEVPIKSKSTRDLMLRVNHANSESPLDYRNEMQIRHDAASDHHFEGYESDLKNMQSDWFRVSGAKDISSDPSFISAPGLNLHRDI